MALKKQSLSYEFFLEKKKNTQHAINYTFTTDKLFMKQ